jgi:hypothetical protein
MESKLSDSDLILSMAGTFTAVCALALSIYEGRQARQHDRLSVRPLLTFQHDKRPDTRALILKNKGLGPAILKRLQLFVRGNRVTDPQDGGWQEVFHSVGISSGFVEYFYLVGDDILDSGSERIVLKFDSSGYSKERLAELDQAMALITANFEYESMYGERFTAQSRGV